MLVTALDARVRLGTHEDHRITFANMAFTDDPGVQRQAAAESAANIAKDLGIALERIGIKSIEGLSGMREYGTAVPGSGSAIDRFSTAENTSRSEVLRDLKLIQTKDYEKLSAQTVEIKHMLTVLVQKLTAESGMLIARGNRIVHFGCGLGPR